MVVVFLRQRRPLYAHQTSPGAFLLQLPPDACRTPLMKGAPSVVCIGSVEKSARLATTLLLHIAAQQHILCVLVGAVNGRMRRHPCQTEPQGLRAVEDSFRQGSVSLSLELLSPQLLRTSPLPSTAFFKRRRIMATGQAVTPHGCQEVLRRMSLVGALGSCRL